MVLEDNKRNGSHDRDCCPDKAEQLGAHRKHGPTNKGFDDSTPAMEASARIGV